MEKTNQQLVASLHSKPPKNMATSCLLRYGPHPPYKDQKRKKVTSSWPTVFRPQIHFQVKTEAGTCPVKTGFNQGTLEQWTMRWAIALVVIGWGGESGNIKILKCPWARPFILRIALFWLMSSACTRHTVNFLHGWIQTRSIRTHSAPSFRLHLHNSASITSASAAVSTVRWERACVPRQQNEHHNNKPKAPDVSLVFCRLPDDLFKTANSYCRDDNAAPWWWETLT